MNRADPAVKINNNFGVCFIDGEAELSATTFFPGPC
jgi:hypothetical protein